MARYDKLDVVMNFQPDIWDGYITILGTKAQTARKLELSAIYREGVCAFVDMLQNKAEPVSHDKLIFPVAVV